MAEPVQLTVNEIASLLVPLQDEVTPQQLQQVVDKLNEIIQQLNDRARIAGDLELRWPNYEI